MFLRASTITFTILIPFPSCLLFVIEGKDWGGGGMGEKDASIIDVIVRRWREELSKNGGRMESGW